jgi:Ca2+-binding EF-hand superfamily protein
MKFFAYAALVATTSAVRLIPKQNSISSLVQVEKHIPDPEEVWKHFDKDNSGTWDLQEAQDAFKGAMEYYGHGLPDGWKAAVKKHFNEIDEDGSGDVCPKEMLTFMFDGIDSNDDGFWQPNEVYTAIEHIAKFTGNTLKKDWKEMVNGAMEHVDTNDDGKASGREVMAALKKYGVPDFNALFEGDAKHLKLSDLVEKRIPSPTDVWNKFDTDGSNSWDLKETQKAFKAAMKYFGHALPKHWKKHVAAEFKKADKDGSGSVSPKEMGVYLFKLVDENDDGVWSKGECRDAIEAVAKFSGNTLKKGWKKIVNKAFDAVDTNNDNKVTPKEAFDALEKHGVPDIHHLFE